MRQSPANQVNKKKQEWLDAKAEKEREELERPKKEAEDAEYQRKAEIRACFDEHVTPQERERRRNNWLAKQRGTGVAASAIVTTKEKS